MGTWYRLRTALVDACDQVVALGGRMRLNCCYNHCGPEEKMSGGSLHPSSLGRSKNKCVDKDKRSTLDELMWRGGA
jgi:hypothetical protein